MGKINYTGGLMLFSEKMLIRKGNSPTIMTSIRHICMGIFDLDTTTSGSLAKKRRKAIWSDDYRAKLVFGL